MVVLFGAGTTGRVVARKMREQGTEFIFADNDVSKWNKPMEGVMVLDPTVAKILYPDGEWICTAMQPKFREGINADLERLGVKVEPVWPWLPDHCQKVPFLAFSSVLKLCADQQSADFLRDQIYFRKAHALQIPPAPMEEIYFPDWITRLDNEHYVDCGAADGDTVMEFRKRWDQYAYITAFEPDQVNYDEILKRFPPPQFGKSLEWLAVGDTNGNVSLAAHGDYSSHLNPTSEERNTITVYRTKLDDYDFSCPPTYIKMDIEGSELEAIWGARETIRKHSPVLSICAYHKADHLWQIPLLIHVLNPEYKLFLRRYAEEVWELVWYAVPVGRLVK